MREQLTPEQRVVMRRARGLARRHARVLCRVDQIEEERTDLYEAGRALDPPLTFRQLAEPFGVTTQSVIQKLDRRKKGDQLAEAVAAVVDPVTPST